MSGNYSIYIDLWTWKDGPFGEDQVGSTACPEDTQHLLVEKRRNPSRHVDSRPAQKQVEMGVDRLLMFKLEYLKMANLSIQLGRKISLGLCGMTLGERRKKTSRAISITFPTWVNFILTKDSPIRSPYNFQRSSSNGRWLLAKIIPDFTNNLDSPKPICNKNPTW